MYLMYDRSIEYSSGSLLSIYYMKLITKMEKHISMKDKCVIYIHTINRYIRINLKKQIVYYIKIKN